MTQIKLSRPEECCDMADVRREIDRLDCELMNLLAKRAAYIDRAAEIKHRSNIPADIKWRVEEVAQNARQNAKRHGLDCDFAETLWRGLIQWSIDRENTIMEPIGK